MQTLILPDFPSPQLARLLSPNGRCHWAAKKAAREQVAWRLTTVLMWQPLMPIAGKARLTIRWVFPQQRRRDPDNATTGVTKALIDQLVRRGILMADDSDHLELAPVEIIVEPGQRRMELRLEAVG